MRRFLHLLTKNLVAIICLLFSLHCFALPLTIVPKVGTSLPTTISRGTTAAAYYTVSNNTVSQRNNLYVAYLPNNVTQVKSGVGMCGATFGLGPKGSASSSCTLQLSVSGPVDGNNADPHQHLFICFPGGTACSGTAYPLNVSSNDSQVVLQSIAIAPLNVSKAKGLAQQFAALGSFSDGSSRDVTTSASWVSSDPTIVSINAQGLAQGLATGVATISANSNTITSNLATMTVSPAVYASYAVTPNPFTIAKGTTQQLTATATFTDGSTQNVSSSVAWVSLNPVVATVDAAGIVTAANVGTVTISATYNSQVISIPVTVTAATLNSIAVTPVGATIGVGATQLYMATGTYSDGTTGAVANAIWASSNASNATIDASTGLATGVAIGSTTISASSGAITSPGVTLTVAALHYAYISLPSPVSAVYSCTINPDLSMTWANCAVSPVNTFTNPSSSLIQTVGGVRYLYVQDVNAGGTQAQIKRCTVNGANAITACTTFPVVSGGTNVVTRGLSWLTIGGQSYLESLALTTSTTGTVYSCPVNATNGDVQTCVASASSFVSPGGVAVVTATSSGVPYIYVVSTSGGQQRFNFCTINSGNGVATGCATTGPIVGADSIIAAPGTNGNGLYGGNDNNNLIRLTSPILAGGQFTSIDATYSSVSNQTRGMSLINISGTQYLFTTFLSQVTSRPGLQYFTVNTDASLNTPPVLSGASIDSNLFRTPTGLSIL